MSFYSIHIPTKSDLEADNENIYVFTEIDEALKVLKSHKEARLKVFKNNEDAIKFSEIGPNLITTGLKSPSSTPTLEKAAFRAPTKQELIQFRKAIEEDKYDLVEKTIWDNPRYLVNSGDTPTSLKDGTRYNALHVCSIHKKDRIADLILQTITKIEFIELMHGNKNAKICREVSDILLDYYLNMPEKGRSETPLHLAVKYGAIEMVRILTTYPQCKMTPNLENLLPKDLVCSRMDNPSKELKEKIASLLEERFYVPVIRSIDNSVPPTIGEPFSPGNPPQLNKDPMSPEVEIQAYAGPMNKEQAQTFRRRWKTPPRVNSVNPPNMISPFKANSIRSSTPAKVFNNNTTPSKGSITEYEGYNNVLEDSENGNYNLIKSKSDNDNNNGTADDSFIFPVPVSTPLRRNPKKKELFFAYREQISSPLLYNSDDSNCSEYSEKGSFLNSPSLKERHLKLSDTEKGLELIGREIAKEQNVEWKEYWDFLGCFIDIASPEGLLQLENYLKSQTEEQQRKATINRKSQNIMKNLCNALDNLELQKNEFETNLLSTRNNIKFASPLALATAAAEQNRTNCIEEEGVGQLTTPYLCVEKSIQVFAKRMTKTIIHNCENIVSISDAFNSEIKRLSSLVCSFKEDSRFLNVDFCLVHSRFVNLIITYLENSEEVNNAIIEKIINAFEQILISKLRAEHLHCVLKFFLEYVKNKENKIQPENLKTETICFQTWNNEKSCNCYWDSEQPNRHANRNFKRSKRMELVDVSRKLFTNADTKYLDCEDLVIDSSITSSNWRTQTDGMSSSDGSYVDDIDDNDDNDVFWSDIGSEDENDDDDNAHFYTPPESPSILELDVSDELFEVYKTYLLGDEPTKRDLDVLNALFNIEIDRDTYPNIHRWRAAVLRHPNEERDNFPSPSVVVKRRVYSYSSSDPFKTTRRLFLLPSRPSPPPIIKSADIFSNFRQQQSLNNSFLSSPSKSSPGTPGSATRRTLSFMNVSQ